MHHPELVKGQKTRRRSERFADHFSQATLFFNSLTAAEKRHVIAALQFELGKVERKEIRQRVVVLLGNVDEEVAGKIGVGTSPPAPPPLRPMPGGIALAPSLSLDRMPRTSIATRKIAVLAADGFSGKQLGAVRAALEAGGATIDVIAPKLGIVKAADGDDVEAGQNYLTAASVLYDAVYVPGGKASIDTMTLQGYGINFVKEAFRQAKPVGASGEGVDFLVAAGIATAPARGGGGAPTGGGGAGALVSDRGVVTSRGGSDMSAFADELAAAIKQHRHWDHDEDETLPF